MRIWHRHTATGAVLAENETALDAVAQLLLRMIGTQGPVRSSALAEQIGLSRAAISRRVAALESAGLVASVRDPHDGRASLLTVSEAGAARLEAIKRAGCDAVHGLVDDFTTAELDALATLLGRLNDNSASRMAGHLTKKDAHDHND